MKLAVLAMALLAALFTSPASAAPAAAPGSAAPPAHFHTYVREWTGHTRFFRVLHDHTVVEHVDEGCCTHAVTLRLVLDDVHGTTRHGSARVRVTAVHVFGRGRVVPPAPARSRGGRRRAGAVASRCAARAADLHDLLRSGRRPAQHLRRLGKH